MAPQAFESPRVRVAALIVQDDRVVLVRHRYGQSSYHLLPGGGVAYRETLGAALVREVAEETGLRIVVGAPLFLSDTIDPNGTRHVVNIVFRAEVSGGAITDSPSDPRVECVDLIDPSDLRLLDLRPPCAEAILEAVRAERETPARYLGSLFTEGR